MDTLVATVQILAPSEQTEGTRSQVLRWLKAVGDPVTLNEPLIELQTDKVTVEIPAPECGILQEVRKHEQDEVSPGEVLGIIAPGAPAAPGAVAGADSDAAQGRGGSADANAAAAPSRTRTVGRAEAGDHTDAEGLTEPAPRGCSALSPAVRRLLTEHALNPDEVVGTGQGGRITVQDVLLARAAASPQSGGRLLPHSGVRKRIAQHMVRSLLHTAPHVTTVFEADLTAVLAHRQANRDSFAAQGVPLTLTAYFLQAVVSAIRAVPEANSRWTDAALEVFASMHIGVATALAEGLVVPVLRHVESLDLLQTARGLHELTAMARDGRLTPAQVRGGTFTVSNHGTSGSLLAAPIIINQPQAAILGVGRLQKRVVVDDQQASDRIVIQPRCYVTLTIDHRVMDGQRANRFMQTFVERLQRWQINDS